MEQTTHSKGNQRKEMKVQFFHKRVLCSKGLSEAGPRGGTTYAVEELHPAAFEHLSKALGITIDLKVGVAQCSLKDNYNKKIGRLISEARAKEGMCRFTVDCIGVIQGKHRMISLQEEGGTLSLTFLLADGSSKVRLVEVNEYKS
jgi:hypothetical protein